MASGIREMERRARILIKLNHVGLSGTLDFVIAFLFGALTAIILM